MRSYVVAICILFSWSFPALEAQAEGGCPPGSVPFQFAPNQPPTCAPMPSRGQQQAPERWANGFGAIAVDYSVGVLGAVADMKSERAAKAGALDDCKAKGGSQCELKQPYRNGCAVAIVGNDPDGANYAADGTLNDAIDAGMETCTQAGAKNCRVYYSACSFPVRIQ